MDHHLKASPTKRKPLFDRDRVVGPTPIEAVALVGRSRRRGVIAPTPPACLATSSN